LPTDSEHALLFQGTALASSTSNLADYALTAGAAVFTNNAGASAPLISCGDDIDLDLGVTLEEFAKFQACFTGSEEAIGLCCESADFNDDGVIDWLDYQLFFDAIVAP
jgi:hypothetical protein